MKVYMIPKPYSVEEKAGEFLLPWDGVITVDNSCGESYFYACLLKQEIRESVGFSLDILAQETEHTAVFMGLNPEGEWENGKEEYLLEVTQRKIRLTAPCGAGLIMGMQTLRQIIRQAKAVIPCMRVRDYPQIANRGYYLDVTRGRIPKLTELKKLVAQKFQESAKFLGDATIAMSFEGRTFSEEEERELLDIIALNSSLHVVCLVDKDPVKEEQFHRKLSEKLMELDSRTGQFYKGNLRSGQVLEFETSVVILGDVNPGAKVVSKGNIIVIGALKGTAAAGASGNENAFVLALQMKPMQIRIGDIIARAPDEPDQAKNWESQIAFVENGNIYIETIDKNVIGNLNF